MALPALGGERIFVEITDSSHAHGGEGWGIGHCLWSPSQGRDGRDSYSSMREPGVGDLVLHFYRTQWPDGIRERRVLGFSRVSAAVRMVHQEPPRPGPWAGMAPYYRIDITDFQALAAPVPVDLLVQEYGEEIRGEVETHGPRWYPFARYGESVRVTQGQYLAEATRMLYSLIRGASGVHDMPGTNEDEARARHRSYMEERRLASEKEYFARNPALRRDAIDHYGTRCAACGFDFGEAYGELGTGYAEVHHIRPFAELRDAVEARVTTLQDVVVLCANCHRMIHRRRPALRVEDLQELTR